jgi:hypothetical protein
VVLYSTWLVLYSIQFIYYATVYLEYNFPACNRSLFLSLLRRYSFIRKRPESAVHFTFTVNNSHHGPLSNVSARHLSQSRQYTNHPSNSMVYRHYGEVRTPYCRALWPRHWDIIVPRTPTAEDLEVQEFSLTDQSIITHA